MTTLICLLALATVFGSAVHTVRMLNELGMSPFTAEASTALRARDAVRLQNAAA